MTTTFEWWDWFSRKGISLTQAQVADWQKRFAYQYAFDGGSVGLTEDQAAILGNNVWAEDEIRNEVDYLRREVWSGAA